MKTLTLIRHGKSSWEYNVSDDERPLKPRGEKDVQLVAEHFKKLTKKPIDIVLTSHAKRAHETCLIFAEIVEYDIEKIEVNEDLYDFSGRTVLNTIKNLNSAIDHVVIFGHNHAFTSLVNMLGSSYLDNLPTSGLASIEFNVENWNEITSGKTSILLIPKELR